MSITAASSKQVSSAISLRPSNNNVSAKVSKARQSKQKQIAAFAQGLNDQKTLGLKPLELPQSKAKTKSQMKDPRLHLLGENPRVQELIAKEKELKAVEGGYHQGIKGQVAAIDQATLEKVRVVRQKNVQDVLLNRAEKRKVQAHLDRVKQQIGSDFRDERKDVEKFSEVYHRGIATLEKRNPKLAEDLRDYLRTGYELGQKELHPEMELRLRGQQLRKWREFEEKHGYTLPTGQEMRQYEKQGAPMGESVQETIHRAVQAQTKRVEIDRSIPKTKVGKSALLGKTKASVGKRLDELDKAHEELEAKHGQSVDRLFAEKKKEIAKLKTDTVRRLENELDANKDFTKNDLPDSVRKSLAGAGIDEGAKAKLVGNTLTFVNKSGAETTVKADSLGYIDVERASERWKSQSRIWPNGIEKGTESLDFPEKRFKRDKTVYRDGQGGERTSSTVQEWNQRFERTNESQDGKTLKSTEEKFYQDELLTSKRSTYEHDAKGHVKKTTQVSQGRTKARLNEHIDSEGTVINRTRVEGNSSGTDQVTTVLLDSASGRSRETHRSVQPGETGKGEVYKWETTSIFEGQANAEGKLSDNSRQLSSRVSEQIFEERITNSEDLNVDGLGAMPWDNPQDLIKDMEARGGKIKIQRVNRFVEDGSGTERKESAVRYFNDATEVTLTEGPEGKNVWTHKVKTKEGKWDSNVLFQGSDSDNITTKNTSEDGYDIATTELRMEDHPRAKTSGVPKRGTYVVKTAQTQEVSSISTAATSIGFESAELEEMDAFQDFKAKVGDGVVAIEIKTAHDRFADASKNSRTASILVKGPNGEVLTLSRDNLRDLSGVRYGWKDGKGRLRSQESVSVQGDLFEHKDDWADRSGDKNGGNLWSEGRTTLKTSEGAIKVGNKVFRASGQISGHAAKHLAPSVDAVSAGLGLLSAVHYFQEGEIGNGLTSIGGSAADIGSTVRASQQLKNSKLGTGWGKGPASYIKKFGAFGTAAGFVSGGAKLAEGDTVGGSLEIASSLLSGAALYGIPGVGWVAGGFALGSAAWDYRNDTVIAPPALTKGGPKPELSSYARPELGPVNGIVSLVDMFTN